MEKGSDGKGRFWGRLLGGSRLPSGKSLGCYRPPLGIVGGVSGRRLSRKSRPRASSIEPNSIINVTTRRKACSDERALGDYQPDEESVDRAESARLLVSFKSALFASGFIPTH